MKVDLLAVGIHPDDVELSASGTLLRHAAQGKTFGLLDLSRGELGTRGTSDIRAQEAQDAARILGASFRRTLNVPDGFFIYQPDVIRQIISVIREHQPEIVLCNAPDDRHPDHGRAAKLVADACFYSGLEKIQILDAQGNALPKWRPKAVYHYIQDKHLQPDFVVDITPWFERKMQAIQAFRSQFYDPNSPEPPTPISGQDFLAFMEAKARVFGRSIQAAYAEGFCLSRVPGVDDLFSLR